eukprot:GHVS01026382.1.p1 GENE.GHVS01026382.1~~GHVS01026382.1.p1  ORF type:complete len:201 (+),score=27.67 GHVS01026382.1:168-770(+)
MASRKCFLLSAMESLLAIAVLQVTPAFSDHGSHGTEFYSMFKPVGPSIHSRPRLSGWRPVGSSFTRNYSICGLSDVEVVLNTGSLELAAEAYAFHANVFGASQGEKISILVTDVNNAIRSMGLPRVPIDEEDYSLEQLSSAVCLVNKALMAERVTISCRVFVIASTSSSTTQTPVVSNNTTEEPGSTEEAQTTEQPDATE